MKTIITLLSILFLLSCNDSNIKEQHRYTKLETFLLDFNNRYPNSLNNPTTINQTSKIFEKELNIFLKQNDSIFYYHPLKFISSTGDKRIFGQFEITDEEIREKNIEIGNQWNVQIILEIPKTQIQSLIVGNYYRVIGEFIDKTEMNSLDLIYLMKFGYRDKEIKKGYRDNMIFNLGELYIKPKQIKYITPSERSEFKYRSLD